MTSRTLFATGVLLTLRGVLAFDPPIIPLNWTLYYSCAVDVPSRILAGDVTTVLSYNDPAACVELCDQGNFTFTGVEYGDECHCGTGIVGSPQIAPDSECDVPCAASADWACGGSWRIQVYKSPALPPGSWDWEGCYVDTSASPAFIDPVHRSFDTNVDLITQCIDYCTHIGMPWVGVENGEDCQCSTGIASGAQLVDLSECNVTCPEGGNAGNEYCGGYQRLLTYEYQGRN